MNKNSLMETIDEMFDSEKEHVAELTSERNKGNTVRVVVSLSMSVIIICSLVYSLLIAIS